MFEDDRKSRILAMEDYKVGREKLHKTPELFNQDDFDNLKNAIDYLCMEVFDNWGSVNSAKNVLLKAKLLMNTK